ncbi:reverse transcriptase family protein [Vreelandella titanicae]|uniref:reverse transcriptase family protein n=1 Tax=Vreelandella titanicae TaxID=664683 RepID=UPI003FD88A11
MNAAPLLVSFTSVNKYLEALPEKHRIEYSEEIERLLDISLPPVVSPYCLAVMFGYSLNFVYALSKKQKKFYRSFEIKQGKKKRKIHSPKVALKVIQKWFGFHLDSALIFPPHIYGFIKGRSFADAAKQHVGANWVFSIDIINFFPSISQEEVSSSLECIGYSNQAAELMAALCCLDGVLAQGSPASPVLSNIYMKKIDEALLEVAKKHNIRITRYADDIVFSGKVNFDPAIKEDVYLIFKNTNLQLNKDKHYLANANKGERLKVHGLLIKDDKITLTKGYRNKLRAYKHMLKTGKICEDDIPRINGHIKFSEFIEKTNKK